MSILAILRIVHILSGVFVAGYYFLMVPIVMPRLKRLGPAIQGPVMQALMPILTPVMATSVILLLGTGIAMTLILRQGALDTLFTTGWGLGYDYWISSICSCACSGLRLHSAGRASHGEARTKHPGASSHTRRSPAIRPAGHPG